MKNAGVIFIILGVLAILFPFVAALSYNYMLAFLVLLGGASHFWWVWRPSFDGRLYHLVLAILFLAGGAALILFPMIGVLSFTLILDAAFLAHGVVLLGFALATPGMPMRWMAMLSGALGIAAGGLIIVGLPNTAAWAVGTIAGINMLFFGATLLSMSRAIKQLSA